MKLNFIFVLMFFCSLISAQDIIPKANHDFMEVILDRFDVIHETPSLGSVNVKVRKVNKVRSLVGNVTLHEDYGNNFQIEVKSLKKQGGEYRYLPYRLLPTNICDLINSDKYYYPDMVKGSELPPECPLPAGFYKVFNVSSDFKNFPRKMFQQGEYCAEVFYYKEMTHIATYKIYAYINAT